MISAIRIYDIPSRTRPHHNRASSQVSSIVMDREWTVGKGCCLAQECARRNGTDILFNYGHIMYLG